MRELPPLPGEGILWQGSGGPGAPVNVPVGTRTCCQVPECGAGSPASPIIQNRPDPCRVRAACFILVIGCRLELRALIGGEVLDQP